MLCETLQLSLSGYHAWKKRAPSPRAQSDQTLTHQIALIHQQSRRTYGSPRVSQALRSQGRRVGRRRVARLMREQQLVGRCRRPRKPRTTDSRHGGPIARNRLRHMPALTGPDQVWAGDITYLRTGEGWLYVAAFIDLYSRKIVGWACSHCLDTTLCLAALQRALRERDAPEGLVLHTDRGVQYASLAYRQALDQFGFLRSMSRKANCYDNAFIESFWSTLKTEWTDKHRFATRAEAELALFDYIETFYNPVRLHSSLGYLSPRDFEQQTLFPPNPQPTTDRPAAKSACHN